jgi:hypothetical protein
MEEWIAQRDKPKRFPKSAPLVEAAEKPAVEVDGDGNVAGTLMTEADFDVRWG